MRASVDLVTQALTITNSALIGKEGRTFIVINAKPHIYIKAGYHLQIVTQFNAEDVWNYLSKQQSVIREINALSHVCNLYPGMTIYETSTSYVFSPYRRFDVQPAYFGSRLLDLIESGREMYLGVHGLSIDK